MKKILISLIVMLLYILPAFTSIILTNPGLIYLHQPLIFSGDEPHYLVMVESIIADRDLKVVNNYETAEFLREDTRYHY